MNDLIQTANEKELLEYCNNRLSCNILYFLIVYICGKEKYFKDCMDNIIITKTFRNKTYFINSIAIEKLL